MIRMISTIIAAAVLTTGAVAALADTGDADVQRVTINAKGDYCLEYRPVTGSLLSRSECRSKADWAKDGVTFNR